MALGAEHGGSTAGRRQRALWIPHTCSARSPGAPRGPCFPAVVPLTWGDPRWPPPRAQSLRESRVRGRGGWAGRPRQEQASPPHGSSAKRWRHTWGGDALRTRWTEMDVTEAALPASSQLNGRRNTHFQTIKLQRTGQCCADFPQCMLGKPHVLSGRVLGAGEQRLCPYLRL